KGKTRGVKIYTVRRSLTPEEQKRWTLHNEGMELYYARKFEEAQKKFQFILAEDPEDFNAKQLLDRCIEYAKDPPPEGWDGVEVMKTK
ncbi:MAG: adenylate/guanylate cyclase domain-containing protein, partial [Spirochaetales bacterium]